MTPTKQDIESGAFVENTSGLTYQMDIHKRRITGYRGMQTTRKRMANYFGVPVEDVFFSSSQNSQGNIAVYTVPTQSEIDEAEVRAAEEADPMVDC